MGIKNNQGVGVRLRSSLPSLAPYFFLGLTRVKTTEARVELAVSFLVSILKRGVIIRSETTKVQDNLVLIEFRFILFLFMYKYTAL